MSRSRNYSRYINEKRRKLKLGKDIFIKLIVIGIVAGILIIGGTSLFEKDAREQVGDSISNQLLFSLNFNDNFEDNSGGSYEITKENVKLMSGGYIDRSLYLTNLSELKYYDVLDLQDSNDTLISVYAKKTDNLNVSTNLIYLKGDDSYMYLTLGSPDHEGLIKCVWCDSDGCSNDKAYVVSNVDVKEWNMYSCSRIGTEYFVWVDGQMVGRMEDDNVDMEDDMDIYLSSDSGSEYKGYLDNVYVWSSTKNTEGMRNLYLSHENLHIINQYLGVSE